MAQHAVLYRSATGAAAVNAALNVLPFTADNVANNQFLPPMDMDILAGVAFSATMSGARIQTPLLNQTASLHLVPLTVAATLPTNFNFADFIRFPVSVRRNENVAVQTSATGAGETQNVILIFGDKNYAVNNAGRMLRIRFTGAVAATAGAWASLTITPDETLPASRFDILGMEVVSATGILARLDIPGWSPGGINLHPGVPVTPTIGLRLPWQFLDHRFGILGSFTNTTIPRLELFATAADPTQQVFLDVLQRDAY